ncbi:MAG: hypothetical protein K6U14_09710 [Firmicutes bacterium]|nr:hypothetical protein [Alicyclobacillaceae bacterium]MCL6497888.1 hypothetical protein [Bacillota bacterium]
MTWVPETAAWFGFFGVGIGSGALPWWTALGYPLGLIWGGRAVGVLWGSIAVGIGLVAQALAVERRTLEREALADGFLRRLGHLLRLHPPARAVEEAISGSDLAIGHWETPTAALLAVARQWPVPALGLVADLAPVAERHGGNLARVVERALSLLEQERWHRERRRVLEAGTRSTAMALSVASPLLLFGFRALAPMFFLSYPGRQPGRARSGDGGRDLDGFGIGRAGSSHRPHGGSWERVSMRAGKGVRASGGQSLPLWAWLGMGAIGGAVIHRPVIGLLVLAALGGWTGASRWRREPAHWHDDLIRFWHLIALELSAGLTLWQAVEGAWLAVPTVRRELEEALWAIMAGEEWPQVRGRLSATWRSVEAEVVLATLWHAHRHGVTPETVGAQADEFSRAGGWEIAVRGERMPLFLTMVPAVLLFNLVAVAAAPLVLGMVQAWRRI